MKLNLSNNKKNETKNVQTAQVNNNAGVEMHQVDVMAMMTSLKRDGHVKLTPVVLDTTPVEDAVYEEIKEEPKVETKKEVKLKRKVSLRKKSETRGKKEKKPQTSSVSHQTSPAYSVVTFPAKRGGNSSKLYGFKSEDDARKMAERITKSATVAWDYGPNGEGREKKERHYYVWLGTRYEAIAAELCAALNAGNKTAVSTICGKAQDVYAMAVAAGKAEREIKRQEREAEKAASEREQNGTRSSSAEHEQARPEVKEEPAPAAKTYTAEEVAAMLEAVANGGMVPENVRKHIKQAA